MRNSGVIAGVLSGVALLVLGTCGGGPARGIDVGEGSPRSANVLVVLLDDVGVDLVGAYGLPEAPRTPNLDALAASGVRFQTAWALPICSPTRAALLTGRLGRRFGIGGALEIDVSPVGLPPEAETVAELLHAHAPDAWSTAFLGKWHLSPLASEAARAPLDQGFDRWIGGLGNFTARHALDGAAQGYQGWERIVDGVPGRSRRYATDQVIDDAIEVIGSLEEPWLAVVALHAAHTPWHVPPGEPGAEPGAPPTSDPVRIRAMVERADRELGRLLEGLGEARGRTVVFTTSDNGSTDNSGLGAFARKPAKSTVNELGVRVPLIVSGPGIPHGVTRALAHVVDIVPTVLAIAGAGKPEVVFDGVSLLDVLLDPASEGPRTTLVSEIFLPDGPGPRTRWDVAVRDARYRMIRRLDGTERLYRVGDGYLEGNEVLKSTEDASAREARARLAAELDRLGGPP